MFYVDGLVHEWVPHGILSGTVYNQFLNVHKQNVFINISTLKYIYTVSDFVCYRIGEAVLFTGNLKHILLSNQMEWATKIKN